MRAVTIREPWAGMIRRGEKTVEVRTWRTRPGPILLCAARRPESDISGHAFAVAEIREIRPMRRSDFAAAGGYYNPAAFAWVLADVFPIEPFPVRGMPGIFHVDFDPSF